MEEILASKLLESGAMFRVTDAIKDSTLPPGSLGFISFIKGLDESYQNLAKICAVIIRCGKTGKPRLMNTTIAAPIFCVDDSKPFARLMPEEGAKKYFVHLERHIPMAADITALSDLEFLGYSVAMSRRIKHMSDQCHHKKWPEDKGHPVNVLKKMPDYFKEDPYAYLEKFATEQFRNNFVETARRMSASLIRMQIQLDITRIDTEINAAEFLLYTNKGEFIPKDAEDKENEYKFTDDNAMLKRTIKFYKDLRKRISDLYDNKRKS